MLSLHSLVSLRIPPLWSGLWSLFGRFLSRLNLSVDVCTQLLKSSRLLLVGAWLPKKWKGREGKGRRPIGLGRREKGEGRRAKGKFKGRRRIRRAKGKGRKRREGWRDEEGMIKPASRPGPWCASCVVSQRGKENSAGSCSSLWFSCMSGPQCHCACPDHGPGRLGEHEPDSWRVQGSTPEANSPCVQDLRRSDNH